MTRRSGKWLRWTRNSMAPIPTIFMHTHPISEPDFQQCYVLCWCKNNLKRNQNKVVPLQKGKPIAGHHHHLNCCWRMLPAILIGKRYTYTHTLSNHHSHHRHFFSQRRKKNKIKYTKSKRLYLSEHMYERDEHVLNKFVARNELHINTRNIFFYIIII